MTFNGGFPGPSFITGNPTTVASVASPTVATLSPANSHRAGWTVFNDSTAIMYLLLGAGASTTQYSAQIPAGSYYELPFPYTGIITATWAAANGNARVWEGS